MFKSLTYLILLSLSGVTFSQLEITNEELIYPERRILYRGMTNYIKVKEADSLVLIMVNSDGDTLYPKDDFYYYRANTKEDFDTLSFLMNDKLIDTAIYQIRYLNKPTVYFGDINTSVVTDTVISKSELLNNFDLTISHFPDIAKSNFYITMFNFNIIKPNGEEVEFKNLGKRWNKENLEILETEIDVGDILWLFSLVCRETAGSNIRRKIDLKLTIIE